MSGTDRYLSPPSTTPYRPSGSSLTGDKPGCCALSTTSASRSVLGDLFQPLELVNRQKSEQCDFTCPCSIWTTPTPVPTVGPLSCDEFGLSPSRLGPARNLSRPGTRTQPFSSVLGPLSEARKLHEATTYGIQRVGPPPRPVLNRRVNSNPAILPTATTPRIVAPQNVVGSTSSGSKNRKSGFNPGMIGPSRYSTPPDVVVGVASSVLQSDQACGNRHLKRDSHQTFSDNASSWDTLFKLYSTRDLNTAFVSSKPAVPLGCARGFCNSSIARTLEAARCSTRKLN